MASEEFFNRLGRYRNQQCGNIRQFAPLIAAEGFCLSRPYRHRVVLARVDR